MDLRKEYQESLIKYAVEYRNIQTVRLGNLSGVVETGVAGELWARQINAKEIKVINQAMVPADFDLRVLVGIKKNQPGKYVILQVMEDYLVPAGGGRVGYHHLQHEFGQPDEVPITRKQVTTFTVRAYSGYQVRVYGGYFQSLTTMTYVATQLVDLTSYVPTAGALYVTIESDDSGVLSVHAGTNFEAVNLATIAYVPLPDPGKYHIATIMLYGDMSYITDEVISVPFPLGTVAKTAGLQINEADADTPLSADQFGFWDVADNTLKSITYGDLQVQLSNWVQSYTHVHGLARWSGAASQTTFELPDVADSISEITINGVEEDPFVYSLSADGTQIVLATGLAAASTVIARYTIRRM